MEQKILLMIIFIFFLYLMYFLTKRELNLETFIDKNKNENEKILNNKVIIITGSTRGIGYEVAKTLNKFNCKLVIHGRTQSKVDSIVEELKVRNPNVIGMAADLSEKKEIDKFFKFVTKNHSKIYALINNAWTAKGTKELTTKSFKDWKSELATNVDSIFLLTQKVIQHMRRYDTKGRIINVSSFASKLKVANSFSASQILSKSLMEKMSEILAEENYMYNIAVTTIRIEDKINTGMFSNSDKKGMPRYVVSAMDGMETVAGYFSEKPGKIIPLFTYALKAPFHEITGKLISSNAYLINPKLSKIIPSHQLILNDKVYKKAETTKSFHKNDDSGNTYLVKQNVYGPSPKVQKLIKSVDIQDKIFNKQSTYKGDLDKIIANKLNINRNQITFFKTEFDAIKKILELFVTKYNEVITPYPAYSYLFMLSFEKKIELKHITLDKKSDVDIQPDYSLIKKFTTPRTKLVYLSSPNFITGQSIKPEEFEKFLETHPDNIPIFIDQSFLEFSNNKNALNPIKYLNKNVIVLRSFNNFYGFENLELSYIIANKEISDVLKSSQIMDIPINRYMEEIAIKAYTDTEYNEMIKKVTQKERKRLYQEYSDNNIKFFPSEVNYFLIDNSKERQDNKELLEKNSVILYESDDAFNDYWTMPIMDKQTNDKVLNIIANS